MSPQTLADVLERVAAHLEQALRLALCGDPRSTRPLDGPRADLFDQAEIYIDHVCARTGDPGTPGEDIADVAPQAAARTCRAEAARLRAAGEGWR